MRRSSRRGFRFAGIVLVAFPILVNRTTAQGEAAPALPLIAEVAGEHPVPAEYPVRLISVELDTTLTAMLAPRPSGWIGSDVAHSIPLPNHKTLWLFGDTLIGTVSDGQRRPGAAFINNSIGIQDRGLRPPGDMQFWWGPGNTSFFPHQAGMPGDYDWPTAGVVLGGELFLFCYAVSSIPGGWFTVHGTTLIRISNPSDPPATWSKKVYDFGIGGRTLSFHSAVFLEEPYVYFLGSEPWFFASYAVLARARSADLVAGGLSETLEYWVNTPTGPSWGRTPQHLVHLFRPGISETNIQYEPAWGLYFCTTYNGFSPQVYLTTARALTGPWSEPVCVYSVPEFDRVPFGIISYAVRPHPELSTAPGELVITYATNSPGDLAPLFTPEGLQIYAPKAIRVRLALNPAARVPLESEAHPHATR